VISAKTDEIGGELCLILIIRDITDRKRAEEAQENLAHASRLALVGELTAMVAHEINQPLGAILSNVDAAEILLKATHPPLNEIRDIISDIKRSEQRADAAIRRMRGLLRKREIQLEPLNLNEIVSDVLQLAAGDAIRRQTLLRSKLAPDLPLVLGDRIHLQQVLLNLIVNGMDAMAGNPPSGRHLTVQTETNGEGAIEVLVADRGPGIPAAETNHIFDSFFTTKKTAWDSDFPLPARSLKPITDGFGSKSILPEEQYFTSHLNPQKVLDTLQLIQRNWLGRLEHSGLDEPISNVSRETGVTDQGKANNRGTHRVPRRRRRTLRQSNLSSFARRRLRGARFHECWRFPAHLPGGSTCLHFARCSNAGAKRP
jgi:hypothetical protein